MRIQTEEGEGLDIQMAPLIDCVFLLLIFFLVATTLKKLEKELQVELPDSGAALVKPQKFTILKIGINNKGDFYLNGEKKDITQVHLALQTIAENDPKREISISGDRKAPFQKLVQILDLLEFEGLKNIRILSDMGKAK